MTHNNRVREARHETNLLWDVVEVADVMELFHLVTNRCREVGVCVPESTGGDPGHKIQVFLRETFRHKFVVCLKASCICVPNRASGASRAGVS